MKADVNLPQQIASKVILHLHGQHSLQSDVDEVAEIVAREIEQSELVAALRTSLAAMQSNIAYAAYKDEPALMRGIDAAREALATIGGEDAN